MSKIELNAKTLLQASKSRGLFWESAVMGHLLTWKAQGLLEVIRFNEYGNFCWVRGHF